MGYINAVNYAGKKYKINDAKEIARGGEGIIYELDVKNVAKIYHAGIEPISQKKFEFLKKLDKNYFIAPEELLFDSHSKVIGFTMPYLGSDFYPLSNIFTKSFCTANSIDKKVKLKIIESLIKAVAYAHAMQIVIGDLNCFNIMINHKGDVKFIDIDSYQAPGFDHSGRLLDDIRDYLYQGRIDDKSDCFALSILAFNMLSFTHPFKGIHKTYIKLSDRMIHKIPVFANDSELRIPKCYEAIQDKNFMGQFERFYLRGERFLLSLTDVNPNLVVLTVNQPSMVKKYDQGDLVISYIAGDCDIKQIFCSDTLIVIETDKDFRIYDAKSKGYVTFLDSISKQDFDNIFVGNKNILLQKGRDLFVYNDIGRTTQLKSFQFPDQYVSKQYENILMVVDYDNMYKIFIDEVLGTTVKMTTMSVFGKGFQHSNSLIYNTIGRQNMFYNEAGKEMSIVSLPIRIQELYQDRNVGIIQYIDNKQVKHKFFKVKDLKLNVSGVETSGWSNFAFRKDKDGEGFIFTPVDDAIKIVRTQDFAEISEMKCDLVSSESIIKNTNSGLVLFDNGKVWLLNKK